MCTQYANFTDMVETKKSSGREWKEADVTEAIKELSAPHLVVPTPPSIGFTPVPPPTGFAFTSATFPGPAPPPMTTGHIFRGAHTSV
jgi:hypothetical protein